jgi:hypothetical protein
LRLPFIIIMPITFWRTGNPLRLPFIFIIFIQTGRGEPVSKWAGVNPAPTYKIYPYPTAADY